MSVVANPGWSASCAPEVGRDGASLTPSARPRRRPRSRSRNAMAYLTGISRTRTRTTTRTRAQETARMAILRGAGGRRTEAQETARMAILRGGAGTESPRDGQDGHPTGRRRGTRAQGTARMAILRGGAGTESPRDGQNGHPTGRRRRVVAALRWEPIARVSRGLQLLRWLFLLVAFMSCVGRRAGSVWLVR